MQNQNEGSRKIIAPSLKNETRNDTEPDKEIQLI